MTTYRSRSGFRRHRNIRPAGQGHLGESRGSLYAVCKELLDASWELCSFFLLYDIFYEYSIGIWMSTDVSS